VVVGFVLGFPVGMVEELFGGGFGLAEAAEDDGTELWVLEVVQ
jgi:hypothetical protein